MLRLGGSKIKFCYRLFSWLADSLLLTVCSHGVGREGEREIKREDEREISLVFLLIRARIPS